MSPAGKWFLVVLAALIILKHPEVVNELINGLVNLLNGNGGNG
jgi:hypothetical protein